MKTEQEVRKEIEKFTEFNQHVLDCELATIDINAPRALMQLAATSGLKAFYCVLGEERPRFACDDLKKRNT